MIDHNGNFYSNFDNNAEFVDINLSYKNLNIQLLVNNIITCTKKRRILETEDKADKLLIIKVIQVKKILTKWVGKKSSKASIPIFGLVGKLSSDI